MTQDTHLGTLIVGQQDTTSIRECGNYPTTCILMYRGSIPLHDVIESIGALKQIKKSDAQATNNKIDAGM